MLADMEIDIPFEDRVKVKNGVLIYRLGRRKVYSDVAFDKDLGDFHLTPLTDVSTMLKEYSRQRRLNILYYARMRGLDLISLGAIMRDMYPGEVESDEYIMRSCFRVYGHRVGHDPKARYRHMQSKWAKRLAEFFHCSEDDIWEVFQPPEVRGIGDFWVGNKGTLIQDYLDTAKYDRYMREKERDNIQT